MAKTYANLLTEARQILQDTRTPYRYADDLLINGLNRGIQEMARIRPDAFWDRFDFTTDDILVFEVVTTDPLPDTDPTTISSTEDAQVALTDTFELSMQFYSPLVYFVAGSAELTDDEYSTDGRASMLLSGFKQQILSA